MLIYSLGSKILVGPFKNPPDAIEPFKADLKPDDIRKLILNSKSIDCPYFVEFSKNLCKYSVYQEIPNFGAQIYYACSLEPIPYWSHSEKAILRSRDVKGPTVSLPNFSLFESKPLEEDFLDNKFKVGPFLESTRITPESIPKTSSKQITPESKPKASPKGITPEKIIDSKIDQSIPSENV